MVELDFKNDNVAIVKHLIKVVDNRFIRYHGLFCSPGFVQRSAKNHDEEWVEKEYQMEKFEEIGEIYVSACKGTSKYWSLLKKYFPKKYRQKLFATYTPKQIMLTSDQLHGTRRNEDMYAVWCYLYGMISKTAHDK